MRIRYYAQRTGTYYVESEDFKLGLSTNMIDPLKQLGKMLRAYYVKDRDTLINGYKLPGFRPLDPREEEILLNALRGN